MYKALMLSATFVLSLSISGTSMADDKEGLYVNLGVTQISSELDLTQTDVGGQNVDLGVQDTDVTLITGRVGYRINKYFAFEGEAGFGIGSDDFDQTVPVATDIGTLNVDTNIDLNVDDYYVGFVRGILPVSEGLDIFARVGYGQATASADVTASLAGISASGSVEDRADDFAYGVGAQYDFTRNDGIRADYTRLDETDIISLSYARRF